MLVCTHDDKLVWLHASIYTCWYAGMLVCWCWNAGMLVCYCGYMLICCCVDMLVCCMLLRTHVDMLVCWFAVVNTCWYTGKCGIIIYYCVDILSAAMDTPKKCAQREYVCCLFINNRHHHHYHWKFGYASWATLISSSTLWSMDTDKLPPIRSSVMCLHLSVFL